MTAAQTCDYLIIGGGSAGAIVARRLADKTSGRIILLEAGKSDEGDPAATDLKLLDLQTADYDWGFKASTLVGRAAQLNYARAKMLGGCANHNDCAFLRPPSSDFAEWQALGAVGWGPSGMEPYYRRVMDMIAVEEAPHHPLSQAFVAGGLELGLPLIDFQKEIAPGVGYFPLNAKGRMRRSSSIAYLHPLRALPRHLEVWTEVQAQRLLVTGTKSVGAVTSRGDIHARRGVILACGTVQTPQLMMLSGLGPARHLREHGIAVVADLPALGSHLRDHVAAPVVWQAREPVPDWDVCPFEATMMLQLDDDAPAPDVLFHFGLRVREKYATGPRLAVDGPAIKASPNVTRARSEGTVRLKSADWRDAPEIALNYLSDPYDRRILLSALRFGRKMLTTKAMAAICEREVHPGPSVQSDDEWMAYIEETCETVYHPCGTAGIGRVVGPDLRVNGIEHLWIADASIFSALITTNINCAVMMAAEKAADLIPA